MKDRRSINGIVDGGGDAHASASTTDLKSRSKSKGASSAPPPEHQHQLSENQQNANDTEGSDHYKKNDKDFFWAYTEEPHRTRRLAIIKAHPEVLKLCGPEPLTKYLVILVVSIQICAAYLLRETSIFSWSFLGTAYLIGATANQNLFLAIHEISHNLAFRSATLNRIFAVFANLPIGIPYSAAFRPYHLTHHKSLGVDGLDTDLPTALEAIFLDSVAGKAFFCTFQILFYALRPMMVYQLPLTKIHVFNVATQILFDLLLFRIAGWRSIAYLVMSSFLAGSLHPCAGHFIAEHYVFGGPKQDASTSGARTGAPVPETFSYYGPLNLLTYNVGLHNEHHDFPAVPWTRLPKLKEIASEFYDELPRHDSWVLVLWQFVWDPSVGLWCRVKRKEGGRIVGGGVGGSNEQQVAWKNEELGANEKSGEIAGVR